MLVVLFIQILFCYFTKEINNTLKNNAMKNYTNDKQVISRYSNGSYSVDVNEVMKNVYMVTFHRINTERKSLDLVACEIIKNIDEVNNSVNRFLNK